MVASWLNGQFSHLYYFLLLLSSPLEVDEDEENISPEKRD